MSAPRYSGATRACDNRGSQEFRPLLRGRGRRKRSVPTRRAAGGFNIER